MPRLPKYDRDAILDAARTLLLARGPTGLTAQGVATALDAPSGSIYHRFPSRDAMAAEIWLRAVDRFQTGLLRAARHDDALEAAARSAEHVLIWSRTNLDDARVLMLFRSSDLASPIPETLQMRNQVQIERIDAFIADLAARLGASDDRGRRRVRFAVIDVPYAAVRPALLQAARPEIDLDELVGQTVRTVLATPNTEESR